MESLCNYDSDDNNSPSPKREINNKHTKTNGMDDDANYEQVTMDMSEQESNHSSTKSPQNKERTSPSSSASSTPISHSPRSHTRKRRSASNTKTSSSDEEKTKIHSSHKSKRNKSRDRHSKKHSHRSHSRSGGRKHSRRSHSHSRSKKRSRRSRSRSRSRSHSERNSSSKKLSPYSRHDSKNHKRHSRSKSKEKYIVSSHNYFIEKKANSKRQILDKLGIELKVPSVGTSIPPLITQVTPQQLLQKSMVAQVEKVKEQTGIELPSYYNPVAVNPNKYAEQIQKRKLLWGNKQNNDVVKQVEESKPTVATSNKTATIWQSTKFGDQDGKVTAKFKRLMGIKDGGIGVDNQTSQQGQSKDIIKKQEEMFNSMESQYEVARMATHTHRGLGLGFGTFQQR